MTSAETASAVIVRLARPSDREVLGRLAGQLVRLHSAWNSRRFLQIDDVEDGYGRWLVKEAGDADALVLLAEIAGAPVGYAYARFEAHDWNALLGPHTALHDILVDPAARGRGVATALLQRLRETSQARTLPRIVLHTAVQNTAGQALFRRFGFEATMLEMTLELA